MAEDWLPHDPPAVQSGGSRKVVFTWIIAALFFIGLYQMFTAHPPAPEAAIVPGYSLFALMGASLGGFALACVLLVWLVRSPRAFNQAQGDALTALAQGHTRRAAELFAALATRFSAKPTYAAVARYNQGYSLLRGGDSQAAAGVLLAAVRTPTLGLGGIRRMASVQLARAFALGGDLAKANAWLESARAQPMTDNVVHGRALVASVELLIRTREGNFDAALAVLAEHLPTMEHVLPADSLHEPRLLGAYATTMRGTPRDAAAAEPYLRHLRSVTPSAVDWLTGHWPELAAFVASHDLAKAA